jgi:hypothetical protein
MAGILEQKYLRYYFKVVWVYDTEVKAGIFEILGAYMAVILTPEYLRYVRCLCRSDDSRNILR